MGMCSKCFREKHAEEAKARAAEAAMAAAVAEVQARPLPSVSPAQPAMPAVAAPVEAPAAPSPSEPAPSTSSPLAAGDEAPSEQPSPSKASNRCLECRKKLGLTGFKCKCGEMFCGTHRYAEAHKCTFDYKTAERAKLAESNPLVQAAKVQKI